MKVFQITNSLVEEFCLWIEVEDDLTIEIVDKDLDYAEIEIRKGMLGIDLRLIKEE
jgi:hypothetical protein